MPLSPAPSVPHRRPRPLLALRRHPRLWWVLVGVAAVVAGAASATAASRAETARAAWGTTTSVVIARHDIAAGEPVTDADVVVEERPRATVPPGAVRRLPPDGWASAAIVEGEVVVDERLAPSGASGVVAALPPGSSAMAIPAEPGRTPPLEPGDRVDVLVAVAADAAGDGPPGFAVVEGALVLVVDEEAVTVAVPRDDAPRVAVALSAGAVSLALVGG